MLTTDLLLPLVETIMKKYVRFKFIKQYKIRSFTVEHFDDKILDNDKLFYDVLLKNRSILTGFIFNIEDNELIIKRYMINGFDQRACTHQICNNSFSIHLANPDLINKAHEFISMKSGAINYD